MVSSPRTGIAFAFACLLILGAMPILSNARPAGSDGLSFAFWLTVWQFAAALPPYLVERKDGRRATPRPPVRGKAVAVMIFTGTLFGLSTWMYVVAAERAGAVNMVIALQAYPLFAMGLEAAFLKKRKSAAEIGFTVLMIAAIAYLTTGGTMRLSGISWWSLFALGIPMIWAIAHVMLRQVLISTPVTPNQVTISRLVISGLFLALVQVLTGGFGDLTAMATNLVFQKAAVVMGVAYYAELILWFHAVRHIDVSLGSSITVPAPAVTMLITVLLLGGTVEAYQIVALCVVVIAMYGLLLAGRKAGKRLAEQA